MKGHQHSKLIAGLDQASFVGFTRVRMTEGEYKKKIRFPFCLSPTNFGWKVTKLTRSGTGNNHDSLKKYKEANSIIHSCIFIIIILFIIIAIKHFMGG